MKKLLSKISTFGFLGMMTVIAFGIHTPIAMAAYSMNSASNDCPTYMVVNATDNPQAANTPCWPSGNVVAGDGDTINLAVYFHNNGDSAADNVSVRITDFRGSRSGTFDTAGQLYVGGTAVKSGTQTITVPNNSTITLAGVYIQTQSNQSWQTLSTASSIFNPGGANIGTVNPGWSNQGVVKAVFKVSATQVNTGSKPTVVTNQHTNLDNSNGSVTLNGSFVTNGLDTTTCFQYRNLNQSAYITVDETNRGNPSGSNPYAYSLSGLSSGTYEFRACARNSAGDAYGQPIQFTINRGTVNTIYQCNDGIDNDNDGRTDLNDAGCDSSTDNSENSEGSPINNMTVSTNSASVSANGNATLYGNYDNSRYYVSNMYFAYRRIGGSRIVLPSAGSSNNSSRSFSYNLTGLSNGSYEYQACADNGSDICGSWVRFDINKDTYVPPVNTNSDPTVQTLTPVSIGYTTAVIDAFYNMNGCSGRTYFEYGTSNNLGQTTGSVSRSTSGSMAQALTGLTSGVTYYYRPVVENCNGTVRGAIYSLTTARQGTTTVKSTTSTGTVKTTVVREVTNTNVVSGGATGTRYVRLTIDNSRDTVARGEELVYDVAWENIANSDIRDLVLEVTFPKALQITSTDRGQIDRDANAVYVNINELRVSEKDDMTIRTKVVGSLKDNDPATARAIIAFENPENRQAQENAIAYDADTFVANSGSVLGASVFGLNGFPGSLAGWLFLILLLILIILVIRYMTRREEHHHYYSRPDAPVAPTKATTVIHEDVDYTPYRPTPKE